MVTGNELSLGWVAGSSIVDKSDGAVSVMSSVLALGLAVSENAHYVAIVNSDSFIFIIAVFVCIN